MEYKLAWPRWIQSIAHGCQSNCGPLGQCQLISMDRFKMCTKCGSMCQSNCWCQQSVIFWISACVPTPYMYLNSVANYFSINRLQTCTKCMLVCVGLIAGPLASAGGQSSFYFCLSAHTIDVVRALSGRKRVICRNRRFVGNHTS